MEKFFNVGVNLGRRGDAREGGMIEGRAVESNMLMKWAFEVREEGAVCRGKEFEVW